MKDFESIVLELYDKNKILGFIDDPSSIKNSTNKLIGKYWKWDKSLPENIIFGLNGSILFTKDSIYINELFYRYKYSEFDSYGNKFNLLKILFSRRLHFSDKKNKHLMISISLTENEFNLLNSIIQSFISYQNKIKKELLDKKIRKEEEERKKYEDELEKEMLIKKEIRRLKVEEDKKKQVISQIILILFEKLRKIKLEENKLSIISTLDKDGNGEIDLVDDEILNKILVNNQKSIIEIDKIYIQKFVKISMYIKTKRSNIQNIFTTIKDTKNDTELNELINLLENQRHTYDLLVFHSINMITSLVESDLITFYQIYECFDELGVFNSNWENEVSGKLSNIGNDMKELMYSIYLMENKIVSSISNLTYITQSSNILNLSVNNQLRKINSSIDYSNYMSKIQNYKMFNLTL